MFCMQKLLVTGADGMVGSYVTAGVKLGRSDLDITDLAAVKKAVAVHTPRAILNLAAQTDLARCERDPSSAYSVNTIGAYNLALAAREISVPLVQISTSGIFDGTKESPYVETDIPNPLNVYGHSKYLGELAVLGVSEKNLVVRTSWVFGGGKEKDKKFVGTMIRAVSQGDVFAVNDRFGSPTYARDLVGQVLLLIAAGASGVHHVAGGGSASRLEVAQEIARCVQSKVTITPVSAAEFPLSYKSGRNEAMLSPQMRPWQEALEEYIAQEWKEV